jgi:hypothetical protein
MKNTAIHFDIQSQTGDASCLAGEVLAAIDEALKQRAPLDRATDYESVGRRFKSSRAYSVFSPDFISFL